MEFDCVNRYRLPNDNEEELINRGLCLQPGNSSSLEGDFSHSMQMGSPTGGAFALSPEMFKRRPIVTGEHPEPNDMQNTYKNYRIFQKPSTTNSVCDINSVDNSTTTKTRGGFNEGNDDSYIRDSAVDHLLMDTNQELQKINNLLAEQKKKNLQKVQIDTLTSSEFDSEDFKELMANNQASQIEKNIQRLNNEQEVLERQDSQLEEVEVNGQEALEDNLGPKRAKKIQFNTNDYNSCPFDMISIRTDTSHKENNHIPPIHPYSAKYSGRAKEQMKSSFVAPLPGKNEIKERTGQLSRSLIQKEAEFQQTNTTIYETYSHPTNKLSYGQPADRLDNRASNISVYQRLSHMEKQRAGHTSHSLETQNRIGKAVNMNSAQTPKACSQNNSQKKTSTSKRSALGSPVSRLNSVHSSANKTEGKSALSSPQMKNSKIKTVIPSLSELDSKSSDYYASSRAAIAKETVKNSLKNIETFQENLRSDNRSIHQSKSFPKTFSVSKQEAKTYSNLPGSDYSQEFTSNLAHAGGRMDTNCSITAESSASQTQTVDIRKLNAIENNLRQISQGGFLKRTHLKQEYKESSHTISDNSPKYYKCSTRRLNSTEKSRVTADGRPTSCQNTQICEKSSPTLSIKTDLSKGNISLPTDRTNIDSVKAPREITLNINSLENQNKTANSINETKIQTSNVQKSSTPTSSQHSQLKASHESLMNSLRARQNMIFAVNNNGTGLAIHKKEQPSAIGLVRQVNSLEKNYTSVSPRLSSTSRTGQDSSCQEISVQDRSQVWLQNKNSKLSALQLLKEKAEMESCTFKPTFYSRESPANSLNGMLSAREYGCRETSVPRETTLCNNENMLSDRESTRSQQRKRSVSQEKKSANSYSKVYEIKKTLGKNSASKDNSNDSLYNFSDKNKENNNNNNMQNCLAKKAVKVCNLLQNYSSQPKQHDINKVNDASNFESAIRRYHR